MSATFVDIVGHWVNLDHIENVSSSLAAPEYTRVDLTSGKTLDVHVDFSFVMNRIRQAVKLQVAEARAEEDAAAQAKQAEGAIYANPADRNTKAPALVLTEEFAWLNMHRLRGDHWPVQHRDGREPWCGVCHLTSNWRPPERRGEAPNDAPTYPQGMRGEDGARRGERSERHLSVVEDPAPRSKDVLPTAAGAGTSYWSMGRLANVNRITVVLSDGKVLERYDAFDHGVSLELQDDGQTLKVFPLPAPKPAEA